MLCFPIASFNGYCDRWISKEEVLGVWRVTANLAEYGDVEVEEKKSIAFVIQTNSIANLYRRWRLIFSCCILFKTIRSLQMHFAFYSFTQQTALFVPTATDTELSSAQVVLKHCIVLCKALALIWTSLRHNSFTQTTWRFSSWSCFYTWNSNCSSSLKPYCTGNWELSLSMSNAKVAYKKKAGIAM